MATELVKFENANLPAYLTGGTAAEADDLSGGVGVGFPIMSIKGKVWTIGRGKQKEVIKNDDGDPRASIEVIIIKGSAQLSKIYYKDGFKEGASEKPTCYSNNAVAPASDAVSPQSTTCATCKHNQWGSRIGDAGQKGKACSDSRRLAVASPTLINDPMLLRVPAASLKPLMEYNEQIIKRGTKYNRVVTKMGFDPAAASPKLTFKPVAFVSQEQMAKIDEVAASDVVAKILGEGFGLDSTAEPFESPKQPTPIAAAPATPKPQTKRVEVSDDNGLASAISSILDEEDE